VTARPVTVTRVDLDAPPPWIGDLADLVGLLDDGERARAAARSGTSARRYVVAHAARRLAVAAHVGCPPAAVGFAAPGPHGQPRLAIDGVHVSLSHSGGYALVAVSSGAAVGVDIEVHRPRRIGALAPRCLSPAELDAWRAVPPGARAGDFYRLWVRKEALLKATGEGLARLREVTATPAPAGWTIADLAGAGDHSAAVAVAVPQVAIIERGWPDLRWPTAGGAGG
jgi:4'-phosphopantetheinyl transferase